MNSYIIEAKRIVQMAFPQTCTYKDIELLCDGQNFSSAGGMFRTVIIPEDFPFVIKVGKNYVGKLQCEREVSYYWKACHSGVGSYFADYYGCFRFHNHYFYVYEKIDSVGDGDDFEDLYNICDNEELLDFLDENNIGDLHHENYGFRDDNSPVIVDWAGCTNEDVRMM